MTHQSFFSRIAQAIKPLLGDFKSLFFAHHPACARFTNHTINIKSYRFCIGCYIGYPSALLSFMLWYFAVFPNHSPSYLFLLIGIIGLLPMLLSFTNLPEHKWIKILQKFSLGFSAGLLLAYGFVLMKPQTIWQMIILFMGITTIIITPIGLLHYRTMVATCKNCDDKWHPIKCDRDHCMAPRLQTTNPYQDLHKSNHISENE